MCLSLAAISSQAKETVVINYAWGPGDSVANYYRVLAKEATAMQDKYIFLFDTKPGAGGALAARHVESTPNTILAHSTAFFIRPVFYPNESYDIKQFRELLPLCQAPMAITSGKYKSWKEVPKDQPLTIGTSGLGVTTHLAAVQVQKLYPNMTIVPFKSTNDAMLSAVSGQTDFHVGFPSEAEQWTKENKDNSKRLYILGITGTEKIKNYTTMISEGFSSSFGQMSVGHHLVVPAKLDDKKFNEWRDLLVKASKLQSVRDAFAVDYCAPLNITDLDKWWNFHIDHWKNMSAGIKLQ